MNKIQQIISQVLEDMNISGDVLGSLPSEPSSPVFNPPSDITSGDKYAPGIKYIPKPLGMIKRNFPEMMTGKKKYKLVKRKKNGKQK